MNPRAVDIQRALPTLLLALAVIAVPALAFAPDGLPRVRALSREVTQTAEENAQLRRDVTRLRAEVAALRDDPAAVEKIARNQLGLVRRNEVVFQFAK